MGERHYDTVEAPGSIPGVATKIMTVCTKEQPNKDAEQHPDAYHEGDCEYCRYLWCPNCESVPVYPQAHLGELVLPL